jgi:lipopolysaccharide export system permease protein
MKVLTRYLLRAHLGPFVFAFMALTSVVMINTVARSLADLAGKGLPLSLILEFFLLALPSTLALTVPMAMLVAVLYTFVQMAGENEITALKASGVDLRRVLAPVLVVGLLGAGGMAWFNDAVLPESNHRWSQLMVDVSRKTPLFAVREQALVQVVSQGGSRFLWAGRADPATSRLWDVVVYDVSDPRGARTIYADSGVMAFNAQQTDLFLTLYDGHLRNVNLDEPEKFHRIDFDRQILRMEGVANELERQVGGTYRSERSMTVAMMQARIDTLRQDIVRERTTILEQLDRDLDGLLGPETTATETGIALEEGAESAEGMEGEIHVDVPQVDPVTGIAIRPPGRQPGLQPDRILGSESPATLASMMRAAQQRIRSTELFIASVEVEIQKKYSIAAAMFIFVLIGGPLAVRFPRGGVGLVIAMSLVIFSLSYIGLRGGESLADKGYVHPVVAMWTSNVILTLVGLVLLARMGREMGTSRGGGGMLAGMVERFGRRGRPS